MLTKEQFAHLADTYLDMVYRIAYNAVKHSVDVVQHQILILKNTPNAG